jgi:aconitate hydratase
MLKKSKNSFQSLDEIKVSSKTYKIFNLKKAEQNGLDGISKLPKSLKVLLENLLRHEDDLTVKKKQIVALKEWLKNKSSNTEIAYRPARVLMQDYTGIPAVADLAAMRDAVKSKNIDPINS